MGSTSDRDAELAPETLGLMFGLAREAPDGQLRAADAVDSKISQAFAAASVLIGLAAVHGPKRDNLATAFLAAAFVILAVVSVRALWSRRFRVPISPHQLWRRYWSASGLSSIATVTALSPRRLPPSAKSCSCPHSAAFSRNTVATHASTETAIRWSRAAQEHPCTIGTSVDADSLGRPCWRV